MAGTTGLEPATSAVTGQRSNQTELRPQLFPSTWGRPKNSLSCLAVSSFSRFPLPRNVTGFRAEWTATNIAIHAVAGLRSPGHLSMSRKRIVPKNLHAARRNQQRWAGRSSVVRMRSGLWRRNGTRPATPTWFSRCPQRTNACLLGATRRTWEVELVLRNRMNMQCSAYLCSVDASC
jgi:hypothetical protein